MSTMLDLIDQWRKEGTLGQISVNTVVALAEVARAAAAVTEHHFDTCDLVLGLSPAYPCSCGVDTLRAALVRLDDTATERKTQP